MEKEGEEKVHPHIHSSLTSSKNSAPPHEGQDDSLLFLSIQASRQGRWKRVFPIPQLHSVGMRGFSLSNSCKHITHSSGKELLVVVAMVGENDESFGYAKTFELAVTAAVVSVSTAKPLSSIDS